MEETNTPQRTTEQEAAQVIKDQETLETPVSLGKVSSYNEQKTETVIEDIGWIKVNLSNLPTQGAFYPQGTEITIRAALSSEIRHWSTIDEEDLFGIDDACNRIAEKCTKIRFQGHLGSFKDIKELDRFFLIFAIREFTFKRGENNLSVSFKCKDCDKVSNKNITKEMIPHYIPDEKLQERFSEEERCFHLNLKNGDHLKLFLPSLGVMDFIKSFVKNKAQKGEDYDKPFIRWAPFLFPDWKNLTEKVYQTAVQDSMTWSNEKISVANWFVSAMEKTVSSNLKSKCDCGSEVTAPLTFPGGVKSLFLISDISDILL